MPDEEGSTGIVTGVFNAVLGPVTMTAHAVTRVNLTWQHMHAAALFSRQTAALERAHSSESYGPFFEDIFANAVGAILCCTAGVEAFANNIFADRDRHFVAHDQDFLAHVWARWGERESAIEKLSLARRLVKAPQMDKGSTAHRNLVALFGLRNALVHFSPEWSDEDGEHLALSTRLSGILQPSMFLQTEKKLFPRAWASHRTTSWAIRAATVVIEDVTKCLSLEASLPAKLKSMEF